MMNAALALYADIGCHHYSHTSIHLTTRGCWGRRRTARDVLYGHTVSDCNKSNASDVVRILPGTALSACQSWKHLDQQTTLGNTINEAVSDMHFIALYAHYSCQYFFPNIDVNRTSYVLARCISLHGRLLQQSISKATNKVHRTCSVFPGCVYCASCPTERASSRIKSCRFSG